MIGKKDEYDLLLLFRPLLDVLNLPKTDSESQVGELI